MDPPPAGRRTSGAGCDLGWPSVVFAPGERLTVQLNAFYATNSTGILPAGSVIAVLPAILLFVLLQRFIVGAFVRGALKG